MTEPIPREYEIFYRDKERKEDILSDTMGLPFQKVKQFGTTKENEWENKLILGDNLQVTKYLLKLKKEGKLRNKDGSDGFKLIYIDPPFATKQEFQTNSGYLAYNDKIHGSEFIEFIRKRLFLLRELLTDDGSIYVHLDYRKSHYVKVVMDEVFGENNFKNEIIWKRGTRKSNRIGYGHNADRILFYTKSDSFTWNKQVTELSDSYLESFKEDKDGKYVTQPLHSGKPGKNVPVWHGVTPPSGRGWSYTIEQLEEFNKKNLIEWSSSGNPRLKRYLSDIEGAVVQELWTDVIPLLSYFDETESSVIQEIWSDMKPFLAKTKEHVSFPTQKPEQLLERIILASSNEGDLVLDSFFGSGTTLAVAEKTGRRWVGIDSSKFSVYTCQKRILNLKKEIGNTGKQLKTKPFALYNAGLYIDGPHLKELDDEEYRNFALELFQAQPADLVLNGFQMNGVLMNSPVHIFPRDGSLTEEYIENLDKEIGKILKERMFIIVPANRVYFLQDYIEIQGKRYYVLRIPYSIIDELHKKKFVRPWQPTSETDMNQVIDSVGFDFIHPPEVEAEYSRKSKDELEIKIKKFESVQRTKNPIDFKDKESLSMVLIDNAYNGEYFNMTDFFFASQIKDNKWKLSFSNSKNNKTVGIVYIDVLGNEKIEVTPISKFKVKK